MENRQEIKENVKRRIVEFMAEEIIKEDIYFQLKQEIVNELLDAKRKIEPKEEKKEINDDSVVQFGDFIFNKGYVTKKLETLKEEKIETLKNEKSDKDDIMKDRAAFIEKLKRGPINPKYFETLDFHQDSSPDSEEIANNFDKYSKYDKDENKLENLTFKFEGFEKENIKAKILDNLSSSSINFKSNRLNNSEGYSDKFILTIKGIPEDKTKKAPEELKFRLIISLTYKESTNSYIIDDFNVLLDNLFIDGSEFDLEYITAILFIIKELETSNLY